MYSFFFIYRHIFLKLNNIIVFYIQFKLIISIVAMFVVVIGLKIQIIISSACQEKDDLNVSRGFSLEEKWSAATGWDGIK